MPGAVTLVGGLLLLVNAVAEHQQPRLDLAHTLGCAAGAAALLVAFAVIERRVANPLVTPHIWELRSLVSASAVMAGVTGAVVGVDLPQLAVPAAGARRLGDRHRPGVPAAGRDDHRSARRPPPTCSPHAGPRLLIAVGLVVSAAGALLLSTAGADATYAADVLPGFLVIGLGVGPMFVAISVGAMSEVPERASGLASGVMMTGHEVGAALGVAINK